MAGARLIAARSVLAADVGVEDHAGVERPGERRRRRPRAGGARGWPDGGLAHDAGGSPSGRRRRWRRRRPPGRGVWPRPAGCSGGRGWRGGPGRGRCRRGCGRGPRRRAMASAAPTQMKDATSAAQMTVSRGCRRRRPTGPRRARARRRRRAAGPAGRDGRGALAAGDLPDGGADDPAAVEGQAGQQVEDADDQVGDGERLAAARRRPGAAVRTSATYPAAPSDQRQQRARGGDEELAAGRARAPVRSRRRRRGCAG